MNISSNLPRNNVSCKRFFRALRHIVDPSPKRGMQPRSLAYLRLLFMSKTKSLLFVSYPSSGWNWTIDIVSAVLTKHFLGDFSPQYDDNTATLKEAEKKPFVFHCPADSRAVGQQTIREQIPSLDIDYWFHSHGYWGEAPLLRLDEAKTVMITRDFPTALYSQYAKRCQYFHDFNEYRKNSGSIERIIKFYNSWHQFKNINTDNFIQIRYEDCINDSVSTFRTLIKFSFGFDADASIIEEALDYYNFRKQKIREHQFTRNEDQHFHFMGQLTYRNIIDEFLYIDICRKLAHGLTDNFGYSLDV